MVPLTERLLNDAGGWQAMKIARGLHGAGRVSEALYEPPFLKGLVREGNTQYRSGLRIGGKTDIENLCTCRDSRARGLICPHSLAVGLEILKPATAAVPMPASAAATAPATPDTSPEVRAKNGALFRVGGDGEQIALSLVLPPNLPDAWGRGSIGVGVECVGNAGRRLVSALPGPGPYGCSEEDLSALKVLLKLAEGELPGMLQLNRSQLEQILPAFTGHPRVMLGRDRQIGIGHRTTRLPLTISEQATGALRLSLALPNELRLLAGVSSVWVWDGKVLQRFAETLSPGYFELFRAPYVEISAAGATGFIDRELPSLRQWFDFPDVGAPTAPEIIRTAAEPTKFLLKLEGSLNYLAAELQANAGSRRTTISSGSYRPASPAEQAALTRLRSCGFDGPTPKGEWVLRGEQSILTFFARDLPALEKVWEVSIGSRFEHVTKDLERVQPRFEMKGSGQNWFEVGFELTTESGGRLSAAEVRRLLASGKRTLKVGTKTAIVTPELLDDFAEVLKDTNPSQTIPGSYRFDIRDAGYLGSYAREAGGTITGQQADWTSDLPFARKTAPPELGAEWSTLRDYQREGITWLNALYTNGLAGVLADEMGLGKTIQALAFLSGISGPKLVVCPASLTLNWQREAMRFAPKLRPCVLSDVTETELPKLLQEDRLLITSYGLLRRDLETIRSRRLAAAILDEAQHIKNPESQTAQAAHRIQADARVALTGTPIENGVRDIWSTMQFLMPGFLGNRDSFRERFELPIRNQPGGAEHQRLIRRLRPFLLRRTKAQVAKELPAKIEQVAYCELSTAQKKLYGQFLNAAHQLIQDAAKKRNPGIAVFTALLRLRQVCCDPRLLGESGRDSEPCEEAARLNSSKLDLLMELLDDAIEDGHRVLVFSQFSSMLKLISQTLEEAGLEYCYLDGTTRDRQAQVDRFQTGNAPVFLISLKAGGVGLNLTAADTVIHYDPWWNPAVEAQASDRVHRIGQTRTVNVYKLVSRDTVEEKILALQGKKKEIAAGFVDDTEPLMNELSFEEIQQLVQ